MNLDEILPRILGEVECHLREGRVADYIPALARVDRNKLGIAVVTSDGGVFRAGDADEAFSIQSISKVFMLAIALGKVGNDLWQRVGREPSGTAFNSIVQLEHEHGIPRNPFINAGAIVTADIVLDGRQADAAFAEVLQLLRALAGDDSIDIDTEVARSESETGNRNRALAYFMRGCGNLRHPVEQVLDVYFHQCAVAMSCVQLAQAGMFLATDGINPATGRRVVRTSRARRINALMLTCGHYDASGDFAFSVGLPGKSGVGGGILAIVPGHASVAVWSPGLNANGNSLVGALALEQIARQSGWSVFR